MIQNFIVIYFFAIFVVAMFILFLINMIVNLKRDIIAKRQLRSNPQTLLAHVKEVHSTKNRIFVMVEYTSPNSLIKFSNTFEFVPTEVAEGEFYAGKEIELIYNAAPSTGKPPKTFPVKIKNRPIKIESGPLFTNILMVALGAVMAAMFFFNAITKNAFNGQIGIFEVMGTIYVLLMLFIYMVLFSSTIESLFMMSSPATNDYLKIYGVSGKAEVKTFKFVGRKNAKGVRQSQIEILFSTSKGEQIQAKISSYLYSETQEQFIDILYDPRQPKNVVYLRR